MARIDIICYFDCSTYNGDRYVLLLVTAFLRVNTILNLCVSLCKKLLVTAFMRVSN